MSQERSTEVRRSEPAMDVDWFRWELCQERQFRLDQLMDLAREETTPFSPAVAEVRAVLKAGAVRALEEIDAALSRLATGVFGACEMCGEMLPLHRLRAIPTVRLCLRCEHRQARNARPVGR
ncbi:TraR/DksA family transcriptional regulator [Kribbella sp. NPDC004138]